MSSNAPCGACKFLRRKCTPSCLFAPYFPPDQMTKFVNVHRMFGASKLARMLGDLNPAQRQDAVTALVYEAEARLREPVYGCVGYIFLLQQRLERIQNELHDVVKELATYIGPAAFDPFLPPPHHQHQDQHGHHQRFYPSSTATYGDLGMGTITGLGVAAPGTSHDPQILIPEQAQQQQQPQPQPPRIVEAQQMAMASLAAAREQDMLSSFEQQQELAMASLAAAREQDMLSSFEQQQELVMASLAAAREQDMLNSFEQQQELAIFNSGFLDSSQGYNQIDYGTMVSAMPAGAPYDLPLVPAQPFELSFAVHPQHYPEQQPQQQQWQTQPQHLRAQSHYETSDIGPSY